MVKVINGYIFARKAERKQAGDLEFAQAIDDFVYRGEIVNIGDQTQFTCKDLKVGTIVYFRKDSGEEITIANEKLKAIKEIDIICYE